eukprot:15326445-Ditylum_brightwellii.AAC.1
MKEKGSTRQNAKQIKRITTNGDKILHNVIEMAINISIANEYNIKINWHKGRTYHECKERSCKSKNVCFHNNKTKLCEFLSDKKKDLNMIIDKKIAAAFSHQEKKEKVDLNKFEALSTSSASNARDNKNKSRVSSTSNEGTDLE